MYNGLSKLPRSKLTRHLLNDYKENLKPVTQYIYDKYVQPYLSSKKQER